MPAHIGRAWITPAEPVVAGALGTWTISYEVGAYGYDERARLKIASRFASDWGRPQFTDPSGRRILHGAPRVDAARRRSPALAFEPRGQVRPWFKCLVVSVADGSLYPGDRVHVTIGDRSGGGPGSRAQTFRERGCEFRLFVDPFGTELYSVLDASPVIDVVGGDLHRLVVVAPTTIAPGEPFDALVKAEDAWGNPVRAVHGRGPARRRGRVGALDFPRASRGGAASWPRPGSRASRSPPRAPKRASRRPGATRSRRRT